MSRVLMSCKATDEFAEVAELSRGIAYHFKQNYVDPEHLLLALLLKKASVAKKVLRRMGVSSKKAFASMKEHIPKGEGLTGQEIAFETRTRQLMSLALDEAMGLGHRSAGSEHILLALVREGGSPVESILEGLGVNLDRASRFVLLEHSE